MTQPHADTAQAPAPEAQALAAAFGGALAARDFAALRVCFDDSVRLRGLIPDGLRERSGADDAVALFRDWFGACDPIRTVEMQSERVCDRLRIAYRFHLVEGGEWSDVEQQAFCSLDAGRITAIDVLCSGFRPLPATER